MQIGILGIGSFLPSHVRKNDWWPKATVDTWREKRLNRMTRGPIPPGVEVTEGVKLVVEQMEAMASDPFDGGLERRVIADDMMSIDMEVAAAERALENAGIDRSEIDVLLLQSMATDHIIMNNAGHLHHRLGLRQRVISTETQGACNGFLLQLHLAQQMLLSGTSRYALIVQSSPSSRIMDARDAHSVWFGDGASAVVLGKVSDGRGLLAMTTRTDGSVHRALVGAVEQPDTAWYEDGNVRLRAIEPLSGRKMLLTSADLGKQALDDVLGDAGMTAAQVDFFACHQASCWFRRAAQKLTGLSKARTVDIFPWAGNLAGASLPVVMEIGVKEGLIRDGDVVAMYGGGSGMTWSAGLLRWGR